MGDRGWSGAEVVTEMVTVAEAANRLGVTHDALRKRIKRGSIEWEANRWS